MPLASMVALSKVDFTTTQFSDLRVAVELERDIRPLDDGVVLEVAVKTTSADEKMSFNLEPAQGKGEPTGLIAPSRPGRKLYAFRLRSKDIETLNSTRDRLLAAKAKGERGTLTVGVSAKGFCHVGKLNDDAFVASTYVATTETHGYVPILRDYDLQNDKSVAQSIANMPVCTDAID